MSDTESVMSTPELAVATAVPQPSEYKFYHPMKIDIPASVGAREAEMAAAVPLPADVENEPDLKMPANEDDCQRPTHNQHDSNRGDGNADKASVPSSTSTATSHSNRSKSASKN